MRIKQLFMMIVLSLVACGALYAQAPVAIVQDSPETIATRIQEFTDRVRLLYNTVEQVRLANETLQNQVKAFKALGEGDFDGFIDAFDYETQTIGDFNDLINGFDYLKEYDGIKKMLDDENFKSFNMDMSGLEKAMDASHKFLRQTQSLFKNTQARLKAQDQIQKLAQTDDSLVGQLQLNNQSLGLLSGELSDILTASMALNNAYLVTQENEQLKKEADEKNVKEFLFDEDNWDSEVSADKYYDTLMNIRTN